MRKVKRIIESLETREGGGFLVHRPFPIPGLREIDPFLLIDEMGPTRYGPGEAKGAPDHPHRGFETVTYVLEGGLLHEDSGGSRSEIAKGDVQWMTAGRGLVHSEMPAPSLLSRGGLMHAVQIWVNLPRSLKAIDPLYQDIRASDIPRLQPAPGVTLKLISGLLSSTEGPAKSRTPILYAHGILAPEAQWETLEVPSDWTALAFVVSGSGEIAGATRAARAELVQFENAEGAMTFRNLSGTEPFSFLLLAGKPIGETIARMGPFVMSTHRELEEAYDDYLSGRMGAIKR